MKPSLECVYFSKGERGRRCYEYIVQEGFRPHTVVCENPSPQDRALYQRNAPVQWFDFTSQAEIREKLKGSASDIFILAGFTPILGGELLAIPKLGTINLHGGKLPEYRGASVIPWQIIQGEAEGGCALHFVDEGIDTGAVLEQRTYPIGPDTTGGEATAMALELFPAMLIKVLHDLSRGVARPEPQDPRAGAYYCKRHPEDGLIDWGDSAQNVHNLIRALHGPDLPGAFSHLHGEKIVIRQSKMVETTIVGPPGKIAFRRGDAMVVCCKDRGLLILEVQGAKAVDYLRPGNRFGAPSASALR